jgi:bacillopeptidase F
VATGSPQWQAGTPTSGPRAAHSGTGAYATGLGGPYGDNQTVFLRSPLIDLGGRQGVTLEFYHWFEFESDGPLALDFGELMVYGADGFPVLTSPFRATGQSGGWYLGSVVIPPDAGDEIQLEFGLITDGLNGLSGWYIDDVSIR